MRSSAKVVGIGKRRTGTSNGNNYDFVSVSFVLKDADFQGFRAETCNIDYPEFQDSGLTVNQDCEIFCHFVKGKMYLDGVI